MNCSLEIVSKTTCILVFLASTLPAVQGECISNVFAAPGGGIGACLVRSPAATSDAQQGAEGRGAEGRGSEAGTVAGVQQQLGAGAGKPTSPSNSDAGLSVSYKFENHRFYIPIIELAIASDGSFRLRYKKGESDDLLERKAQLRPETVSRIGQLLDSVRFFQSNEDYQSKRDFSHLGWITITARAGGKERTARFNYSSDPSIMMLAELLRAIATQQMDLFEIELAVQHQPLDSPRAVDALENDLRLERIAEPESLLGPLKELSTDDTLPLITRNQAVRLMAAISKGKFKSPAKAGK